MKLVSHGKTLPTNPNYLLLIKKRRRRRKRAWLGRWHRLWLLVMKKREDIYRLKRCLMDFKTKNHHYLFPDLFDPWISRPLNWFTKWSIVLPSVELEFFLFVFLHLVLSIVIILVIFVVYSNLLNSLVSFMLLALFGHL